MMDLERLAAALRAVEVVGTAPVDVLDLAYDAREVTPGQYVVLAVTDTTGPVIGNAVLSKTVLWPPNHKMVDVNVGYLSADNCGGAVTTTLSVTSNEPVNGTGDGDTAPDWEVIDNHRVLELARASEKARRAIGDREVVKEIVRAPKLVNIVPA